MTIPTWFAHTDLISVVGDLSPVTRGHKRSSLASFYGWCLMRQAAGEKIEPKFYSDRTGIARSVIYTFLDELTDKGCVRGGDTTEWEAVPLEDIDVSSVWNGVSSARTERVLQQDNTMKLSKKLSKKETKNEKVLSVWKKHSFQKSHLVDHQTIDDKSRMRLLSLQKTFPAVDLAEALDAYLVDMTGWLAERWRAGGSKSAKAWTLRAILNFDSFSDSLQRLAAKTDSSSNPDRTTTVEHSPHPWFLHHTDPALKEARQQLPLNERGLAKAKEWDEAERKQQHSRAWLHYYQEIFND